MRFRAAIKEPEELAYIFFAIAIGLGLGANQEIIVIAAFFIGMVILWGRFLLKGRGATHQNLYLSVSAAPGTVNLEQVIAIVKEVFGRNSLRRYDESNDHFEVSFLVDSPNQHKLADFKQNISRFGHNIKISFIENKSF